MGLFSNSGKSSDFYDAFCSLWKLLVSYSYKEISRDIALTRIDVAYLNVLVAAKAFNDPFNETFKHYSNNSSILGEKLTIAEGVAIIHIALNAVSQGTRLSSQIEKMITEQAKSVCATYDGKESIRQIIEGK